MKISASHSAFSILSDRGVNNQTIAPVGFFTFKSGGFFMFKSGGFFTFKA